VLLRLAVLTGNHEYRRRAQTVLELVREPLVRYPLGFARLLSALDFFLSAPKEIAIIGQPGAPDMEALVRVAFECYLPNKVVAGATPGDREAGTATPLLEQRIPVDGKATAYVCEHYTCLAPVTSPDELRQQLVEK
jgi:uncharacterized protein YyaL (SSP411 family)